jgi:hypothetical protein
MAARIYQNSPGKQPFRIVVPYDLGMQLGITPGEWFAVSTAVGAVHIEVDEADRWSCGDCGSEGWGFHACEGVPGGFGDDDH